jgi:hypothetical protein
MLKDTATLTNKEIDRLIDAEYGDEPVGPKLRKKLRADARRFGATVIIEEGAEPFQVEPLPGHTEDDAPDRTLPEVRLAPELVIRAWHLGWTSAQLSIAALKHACPWAADISFNGHVDRNN